MASGHGTCLHLGSYPRRVFYLDLITAWRSVHRNPITSHPLFPTPPVGRSVQGRILPYLAPVFSPSAGFSPLLLLLRPSLCPWKICTWKLSTHPPAIRLSRNVCLPDSGIRHRLHCRQLSLHAARSGDDHCTQRTFCRQEPPSSLKHFCLTKAQYPEWSTKKNLKK